MHYVELDDAGCLVGVFPLEGEQAGTEFYDGIMLLVVAEGGNHSVVVKNITEAVSALFDVDVHKIKIVKGG
jgi:hypothetical protein